MAYVYRHIRLDKNEPFYIGISKRKRRCNDGVGSNRNIIWKRIVNKTEYEVEIIMDDLSWEDAKKKEIEFIQLYGRIDLGTGILSNMTNGGEGRLIHDYCQYPLYTVWTNLKKACYNSNNRAYYLYGGKGVLICDNWVNNFMNFYNWAINNNWVNGCAISRKNKNEGFTEENTIVLKSTKDIINYSDRFRCIKYNNEMYTSEMFSDKFNIPLQLVKSRRSKKWDADRIINTPVMECKRNKSSKNKNNYNGI